LLDAVRDTENVRVQKVHLETVSCSKKNKCNSCVRVVQGTDVQTVGTVVQGTDVQSAGTVVQATETLCTAIHLAAVWSVSLSSPLRDV
jgi:hypothetical protein